MKITRVLLCGGIAAITMCLASCSSPIPVEQDGADLWFANSRPYEEVLGSVKTVIDESLAKEELHIYDADGQRFVAGGSEAGVRYGVYALQRAEVLGQAGEGIDIQEKPRYEYRILNHWDGLNDTVGRGYAGKSIWEWTSPDIPEARIRKYAELCASIPDFGGFLIKANSEGQAGPLDYGRTHADGANMLAEAVGPHGGIVMWRAFVYDPSNEDRANQAVEEFQPLDGQFMDNVIIQIKNGPIDFQPREPFNPLFGQLYKTNMMMEFQLTQEYLGFSNHLVYHGTTYEEALDSDTYRDGEGSTVANMIKGVAGVANTGQDANFCGYIFAQSNWYVFGRLAWDPELSASQIADEWVRQTFIKPDGMSAKAYSKKFIEPVDNILMSSRETAVNYMQPLGFHHIFAGSHYGPGPWDYKLSSGKTLWDEICLHYDSGISQVEAYQKTWASLKPYVSEAIFNEVSKKLDIQKNDAEWWRDGCVGFFQLYSKKDLPEGVRPLNMPIDSVMTKSVKSDRYGLPFHDENNKPILQTNRASRLGAGMSSFGPVPGQRP